MWEEDSHHAITLNQQTWANKPGRSICILDAGLVHRPGQLELAIARMLPQRGRWFHWVLVSVGVVGQVPASVEPGGPETVQAMQAVHGPTLFQILQRRLECADNTELQQARRWAAEKHARGSASVYDQPKCLPHSLFYF